jgi:hypothetical protein
MHISNSKAVPRFLLGFLLAAAAATAPGLGRGSAQDQPPRAGLQAAREERAEQAALDVEGLWQLSRFDHAENVIEPGTVAGWALFSDGAMAISIHAIQENANIFDDGIDELHQGGIHQYMIDGLGRLITATLIGESNFSGDMLYELPRTPRVFELAVGKSFLALTREDGSTMHFTRAQATFPREEVDRILREREGVPPVPGEDG